MAKKQLRDDFDKLYDEQYLSKGKYIDGYGIVVKNPVGSTGKVKMRSRTVKESPSYFSEEEIRRNNYRRKLGAEEAGKFICD